MVTMPAPSWAPWSALPSLLLVPSTPKMPTGSLPGLQVEGPPGLLLGHVHSHPSTLNI